MLLRCSDVADGELIPVSGREEMEGLDEAEG